MPSYVSVAQHEITPRHDGTVAPGAPVELTEDEAAMWVDLGHLVRKPVHVPAAKPPKAQAKPQPGAPAPKKSGASKENL